MITVSMTRKRSNAKWSCSEHAELGRTRDRAALRRQFAGQQLHERRLAGAVRAGEAVAAAGMEGGGHLLEEDLGPIPHRDIAD